jgi:hypothetical protein
MKLNRDYDYWKTQPPPPPIDIDAEDDVKWAIADDECDESRMEEVEEREKRHGEA